MKKILKLLPVLFTILLLTGCGNSEKQVLKDITNQLASIKVGEENLIRFDMFNRMNIKDSKLNIDDISNTKFNSIFQNMSYEVKDIEINKSTAIANIEIITRDVDAIISQDYVISNLLLEYENYISMYPNSDRITTDTYLLNYLFNLIANTDLNTSTIVTVNVYYSADEERWSIAYDDDFLDALLGIMEESYVIDLNDICEENKEDINIAYNYDKLLNLPESNKSTRSSIKNPISVNEEAYFDNHDYFFEKEKYELKIKVIEITRGSNALSLIRNADSANNKVLDSKTEYILFKVRVKLENNLTSSKTILIDENDFSLLDSNGHYYNNCIIFGLDKLQGIEEGEETEGYICFTIDKSAKPYLLFKDYMDNTLCFSY